MAVIADPRARTPRAQRPKWVLAVLIENRSDLVATLRRIAPLWDAPYESIAGDERRLLTDLMVGAIRRPVTRQPAPYTTVVAPRISDGRSSRQDSALRSSRAAIQRSVADLVELLVIFRITRPSRRTAGITRRVIAQLCCGAPYPLSAQTQQNVLTLMERQGLAERTSSVRNQFPRDSDVIRLTSTGRLLAALAEILLRSPERPWVDPRSTLPPRRLWERLNACGRDLWWDTVTMDVLPEVPERLLSYVGFRAPWLRPSTQS